MEFRVLGPLEVSADGEPIAISAPRPRAVLAALLLRAGEAVSPDALAEAVWAGRPPASHASLLRLYASQLRRALPAGRLVTRSPGYALVVEAGELDAERFERLLGDARTALLAGDARLGASLCARALALWRGDALADLAGEPFARDEATRLDELRLACVETHIEASLQLGRHDDVLVQLEALVAEHPLRERLRGQLMLALYRAGRQAEALERLRAGRELLIAELGLEPGGELRALERRILLHDPSLQAPRTPDPARTAIPRPATPTVGRERELVALRDRLLDPATRLVTLVGPGGIGKTRLAAEVARRLEQELADGAVAVELAAVGEHVQLLPSIGRALGLREHPETSWADQLAERLAPLELLLLLDNLEHLVEGVASLAELLAAAPRLTVLATSRAVLRLSAEHVVEVPPLARGDAIELLEQRSLAAGAAGEAIAADRSELGVLCELLEDAPLAIELAAPWLRSVPAEELVRMLDSRLEVLSGGPRDAPERHRSLRAAIDWGFGLLDPGAQRLLGRLAVFAGGFTTEAAVAVGGPGALDGLGVLIGASMVQTREGRHRLLDVVREYARELPGADAAARDLHASFLGELAERGERELAGAEQAGWLVRLELEHDNFRVALEWLRDSGDASSELRLAAALGRFWYIRGYVTEGLAHLQGAASRARAGDEATLAKALRTASALALIQGDYPVARVLVERALVLCRALGDAPGAGRCLSNLGAILHAQGELEPAAARLDEAIEAGESLGDGRLIALARNNRGDVALSQGDLATAVDQFELSLALLRAAGDTANVARALYNLGAVAAEQGRGDDARTLLGESIELSERVGDREDVAWCLIGLAAVAATTGQAEDGARLLGAAHALLAGMEASMKPFERSLDERTRRLLHARLGATAFASELAAGAALPRPAAVALARALAA